MKPLIRFMLLSIIILTGCEREPAIDLVNGYQFLTTNAENHYIIRNGKFVVDGNITEYDVSGKLIFGYREASKHPDIDENHLSKKYGYFVLDTETGKLKEGLSKNDAKHMIN